MVDGPVGLHVGGQTAFECRLAPTAVPTRSDDRAQCAVFGSDRFALSVTRRSLNPRAVVNHPDLRPGKMSSQLIATGIIVGGVIVIRAIAGWAIRRRASSIIESARRWIVLVRNVTLLAGAFALIIVWSNELRTVAVSLVAFAVALVFAGTEILRALSASMIRANSRAFTVGDRIQVGDIRGEVIDQSLMTTTVLEIGKAHIRTGRRITIPNGRLLTDAVINETVGHRYILHSFTVPVSMEDWSAAHEVMTAAATEASAPYVDEARRHMQDRAHEYAIPMPIVEPFVMARPGGTDTVEMTVRVPVAAADAWKVENRVIDAWLGATS